jgi:hypothetical protein
MQNYDNLTKPVNAAVNRTGNFQTSIKHLVTVLTRLRSTFSLPSVCNDDVSIAHFI